jgi:hypothetical protein
MDAKHTAINKKYIGLRAYTKSGLWKGKVGTISPHPFPTKSDSRPYLLLFEGGGGLSVKMSEVVLVDEVCGYVNCSSREVFQDGLCEICYNKFREF